MHEYRDMVVTNKDGVATIRLNRPEKLNALTLEAYQDLAVVTRDLDEDPKVRVVVLTGTGRGFCPGGDINQIITQYMSWPPDKVSWFTRVSCNATRGFIAMTKPTIAAVNGVCIGAGAVLAAACDFRIAVDGARFGFVFNSLGLSGADMGATWLLTRQLGTIRATELLMLGEIFDAKYAQEIGFTYRVVPQEKLQGEVDALAGKLAKMSAFGNKITKQALVQQPLMGLDAALDFDAYAQALCMSTADHREGYNAFREKRQPKFS
ncbi:MAG: enoyl-CoA hydratase/isomerase family protein [Chloroflexi bacterium]|nr:enoyl-CoA hydratase/isomerase family protein [Chloroflexota bacterium]